MRPCRWRAWSALAIASAIACVPASEPLPPAGAAGFRLTPSLFTAGSEDLTTAQGRVHLDAAVLFVGVNATASLAGYAITELGRFLVDARGPADVYVPALPPGTAAVQLELQSAFFEWEKKDMRAALVDDAVFVGIDAEDEALFFRHVRYEPRVGTYYGGGLTLVATLTAPDGSSRVFELTCGRPFAITGDEGFGTFPPPPPEDGDPPSIGGLGLFGRVAEASVEVRGDALASVSLVVRVEHLFDETLLEASARLDADGDGRVTDEELEREPTLRRALEVRCVQAFTQGP